MGRETLETKNAYHIEVLNSEMGETRDEIKKVSGEVSTIRVEVSAMRTDLEWLKKSFWVIATSSFGALVAALFNIISKI